MLGGLSRIGRWLPPRPQVFLGFVLFEAYHGQSLFLICLIIVLDVVNFQRMLRNIYVEGIFGFRFSLGCVPCCCSGMFRRPTSLSVFFVFFLWVCRQRLELFNVLKTDDFLVTFFSAWDFLCIPFRPDVPTGFQAVHTLKEFTDEHLLPLQSW